MPPAARWCWTSTLLPFQNQHCAFRVNTVDALLDSTLSMPFRVNTVALSVEIAKLGKILGLPLRRRLGGHRKGCPLVCSSHRPFRSWQDAILKGALRKAFGRPWTELWIFGVWTSESEPSESEDLERSGHQESGANGKRLETPGSAWKRLVSLKAKARYLLSVQPARCSWRFAFFDFVLLCSSTSLSFACLNLLSCSFEFSI